MTALVGRNGSGESNVADVLRFVSDCLRMGLEAAVTKCHGIDAIRRFSTGHPFDVSIHIDIEDDAGRSGFYEIVLGGDRGDECLVKWEVAEFWGALDHVRYEVLQLRVVGGVTARLLGGPGPAPSATCGAAIRPWLSR